MTKVYCVRTLFQPFLPPTTPSSAREKEHDWCSVSSNEINALHNKSHKNCWIHNSIVKTQRNLIIPLVLVGLGFLDLYVNWKFRLLGLKWQVLEPYMALVKEGNIRKHSQKETRSLFWAVWLIPGLDIKADTLNPRM